MNNEQIQIEWPNGLKTIAHPGSDWLKLANKVGISIPTGCMGGSCGACEIDVNGKTTRVCIENVPYVSSCKLKVSLIEDPYW